MRVFSCIFCLGQGGKFCMDFSCSAVVQVHSLIEEPKENTCWGKIEAPLADFILILHWETCKSTLTKQVIVVVCLHWIRQVMIGRHDQHEKSVIHEMLNAAFGYSTDPVRFWNIFSFFLLSYISFSFSPFFLNLFCFPRMYILNTC